MNQKITPAVYCPDLGPNDPGWGPGSWKFHGRAWQDGRHEDGILAMLPSGDNVFIDFAPGRWQLVNPDPEKITVSPSLWIWAGKGKPYEWHGHLINGQFVEV